LAPHLSGAITQIDNDEVAMSDAAKGFFLFAMFAIVCAGSEASAQSAAWRVSKSSGEVWVGTSGVQQASLTDDAVLNPGDNIRTGRNGRVLLVRGQEQILISPNSVIGLPAPKTPGTTTVIQQSGTILLEVEKRNVQHFEVETPYLAAVVKGTQFRVTVGQGESFVTVLGGQVDVTDFRSGQSGLVQPGQMAKVAMVGKPGLVLSGPGTLSPIRPGTPRTPSVAPIQASAEAQPAADSAPTGQQLRMMPPRGEVPSFASFERRPANDGAWNATRNYVGSFFGKGDGAQVRNERDAAMIAIPLGFGAVIAFVVAAKRRRQKQKPK
jgi:hypothetical protein